MSYSVCHCEPLRGEAISLINFLYVVAVNKQMKNDSLEVGILRPGTFYTSKYKMSKFGVNF